jgi:hypothetical protein
MRYAELTYKREPHGERGTKNRKHDERLKRLELPNIDKGKDGEGGTRGR